MKMSGGEDWIMRPVLRGMCTVEALKDGRLTLGDVAMMNEALDVDEENRFRVHKALSNRG